ncbi:MAG: hypothetical protein KC609_24635, partial [Myxococcales bacterium]|nr:hypothetical protein [Myxococcales bacterium]
MSHHSRRWPLVVLVVFWSFVSAALQAATVAPLTLPGDPGLDPSGLPPIYFRARELLRHRRVPTSTPLPSMKWTPLQPPTIEYEYVDVTVTLSPPSNQIAVDI